MPSEMLWGEMAVWLVMLSSVASGFATFRTGVVKEAVTPSMWFSVGVAFVSISLAVICTAIWTMLCG